MTGRPQAGIGDTGSVETGPAVGAVVVAAGRGERFGGAIPKQFLPLAGRPLLAWTLEAVVQTPEVAGLVLVLPPDRGATGSEGDWSSLIPATVRPKLIAVVEGGITRQESVARGVSALLAADRKRRWEWVAVHDGVRPLATPRLFRRVIAAARAPGAGAAVAALPVSDTVKRGEPGEGAQAEERLPLVAETVDRTGLWAVQTPQVFRIDWYEEALRQARAVGRVASDEAGLLEAAGFPVRLVPGERANIKITVPEDLELAEAIMARRLREVAEAGGLMRPVMQLPKLRVGLGTDVHRLVAGRPLVLGGVTIPYDLGLAGHSDADVLTHAVIDACLGAAGLGDIGRHFPDTDPRWEGVSSLSLLARVRRLLEEKGWQVVNVDTVVAAERPRLAPYAEAIVARLAETLGVDRTQVSFKAKTGEGLGWVGAGEGMAAEAVVLLLRAGSVTC